MWKLAEELMEAMARKFCGPDGSLEATPEAQSQAADDFADAWLLRWLREKQVGLEFPPGAKRNLYARFAYAKQFAAMAQLARTPLPEGAPIQTLYEELLIGQWHRGFRETWIKNPARN